jgi:hypothetical protein
LRPGGQIKIQGRTLNVKQATTKEIEQHALHGSGLAREPAAYHKNAMVNTLENVVHLQKAIRNLELIQKIKMEPEWLRLSTQDANKVRSEHWEKIKLPAFQGWYADKKLAGALNDYYKPGLMDLSGDALAKINRFIIGSIFWNPIPHIENVGGHWFVSRGFDWIRPDAYRSVFKDGWKAFNSVVNQDKLYQDLLREGSGLVSGGVRNQDFYRSMALKMGMDIHQHPERWGTLARALGLNTAFDLGNKYFQWVRQVLWQANDVFMMQRVLELEGRGYGRQEAIKEAERDIPNYRIPPTVLGSRDFSRFLQDPNLTVFSRYHYGVFKAYAEMLKGIRKGNVDDVGKLFALATLTWGIYPVISAGLQKLTGDPNIQKLRRGPAAIPYDLTQMYEGDSQKFFSALSRSLTLSPLIQGAEEIITGRDALGRNIIEPGDERAGRLKRVAAQAAEYAAGKIGPYQVGSQMFRSKNIPGTLARQLVGTSSAASEKPKGKVIKAEKRGVRSRQRHPRGPIEGLFGKD